MKKRIIAVALFLCMLLPLSVSANSYPKIDDTHETPQQIPYPYDSEHIFIYLNGKEINSFSSYDVILDSGCIMTDFDLMFTYFYFSYTYNYLNSVVKAKNDKCTINFYADSWEIEKDGNVTTIASPARWIGSSYMIPINFVPELMGYTVDWISGISAVYIYDNSVPRETTTLYDRNGQPINAYTDILGLYYEKGYNDSPQYVGTPMFNKTNGTFAYVRWTVADNYRANGWVDGYPVLMYYGDPYVGSVYPVYVDKASAPQLVAQGYLYSWPQTVTSFDGRKMYIEAKDIEAYKSVGWFYEYPALLYAEDGRTLYVSSSDIVKFLEVGWFWGKPITVYTLNGDATRIGEDSFNKYNQEDPYCPMYYRTLWEAKQKCIELYGTDDISGMVFGQGW